MARPVVGHGGDLEALRLDQRAAWREAAAGRRIRQVGHLALDDLQRCRDAARPSAGRRGALACTGAAGPRRSPQPGRSRPAAPRTSRPTRSASWATTPRSWAISRIPVPWRSRRDLSRLRICAWIVTSRAVVGSSARRSAGLLAMAAAITTRCRMPPLKRWGASPYRCSGAGMPTSASSSRARARAVRPSAPCARTVAAIWSPMEKLGSSDVSGSWNTMPMALPRSSRSAGSERPTRSRSRNLMLPATSAAGGRRPRIASAVVDLPHPDSPTSATISPGRTSNETSSTARTGRRRPARYRIDRCSTERSASLIRRASAGRTGRAARRR